MPSVKVVPEAQSIPNRATLLAGGHVGDHVALLEGTLVNTDVGELAIAVVHELECVADERCVVFGLQHDFGFVVVEVESLVFNFGRVREVVDNAVEELLDTNVLVSGTHEHRGHFEADGSLADGGLDEVLVDFVDAILAFHSLFHDFVAVVCAAVDQLFTVFVSLVNEFGRDFLFDHVVAVSAFEVVGLHFDEVDHALQLVFETDRNLHDAGLVAQGLWLSFSLSMTATRSGFAPERSHLFTNTTRGTW